jgi:predicted anti-sigma-YlaC factor YlaD
MSRNRWMPDGKIVDVDHAIDATKLMLRRPRAEYITYSRSALAVSEKELDLYVMIAATKIRVGESTHVGEQGVWAYAIYGLMEALSTHKFERAVK